jgi:hypothetical protein
MAYHGHAVRALRNHGDDHPLGEVSIAFLRNLAFGAVNKVRATNARRCSGDTLRHRHTDTRSQAPHLSDTDTPPTALFRSLPRHVFQTAACLTLEPI